MQLAHAQLIIKAIHAATRHRRRRRLWRDSGWIPSQTAHMAHMRVPFARMQRIIITGFYYIAYAYT